MRPPKHQPTRLAPNALLTRHSPETAAAADGSFRHFLRHVAPVLGEPFFAEDGFILYRGDCVELLGQLAANAPMVRLTVTSPPYNIGKEYEQPMALDQYLTWCARWMQAIHQITAADGAFWLNLGYVEVPERGKAVPLPYLLWDKSPFHLLQEVVWNYAAGVATKRTFCPRNEKWLFCVRDSEQYVFNLDDVRDPDVKYPKQKKNGKLRCNPLGKNPSDVWHVPKVTTGENRSSKERTSHPAQFPLAVVDRIVKVSSEVGDVVLDPFAGSGSSGIAAVGNGRVFIGFELREDYCRLAVERFQRFQAERRLHTQAGLFSDKAATSHHSFSGG